MIRVRTPSRLHFGLMSLPTEDAPARRCFGGVGLMIDKPGVDIRVEPADEFSATGPLAERALKFARTYCERTGITGAFRVYVESAAPEHMGLGTGTQLGLAVAWAIAHLSEHKEWTGADLAKAVDRGRRSAIGVHGFWRGEFLVEGGKFHDDAISPLVARHRFPLNWRILLIFPREGLGTHGADELGAFAALQRKPSNERLTDKMCRLVLLQMVPALADDDLDSFGEALYEYNRLAGEMFQSVQGGIYANAWVEATVQKLRAMGIKGVGQSSWGPVVFGVIAADGRTRLQEDVARAIEHESIMVTRAADFGAKLMVNRREGMRLL